MTEVAAVICRLSRRAIRWRPLYVALSGTALTLAGGVAPSGATPPPAPTNAQIGATQQQVTAIEGQIAHEQQLSDSLSQRFDAAQQEVQTVRAALATTATQLTATRAHLAVDRRRLRKDAVNAYIYGVNTTSYASIFTNPSAHSDAAQIYANTAVGDVAADAAAVVHTQSKLEEEQTRQEAQAKQASDDATKVQGLEVANQQAQAAAQLTLQQVKGTLAQEVAAAAGAQAQAAAAAAAAAQSSAQAQKDAATAAGAAAVAGAVGGAGAGAQATNAANQAAGSGGGSGSSGGAYTGTGSVGGSGGSNSAGAAAVAAAESQLGVPYQWGGETPGQGFDCSGLTQWAWSRAGVSIPRTSQTQWAGLPHVSLSSLEPGDLLFYYNLDNDDSVDHVVMFVGSGPYGPDTIIQAPFTGATVSYSPVFTEGLIGAARP